MNSQIKHKAIHGMAWTGIGRFVSLGVQFLTGLIIARLLMPSDYGIIGMLAVFMAISYAFLDSGFASALIRKKNCTDLDYSTVFWFDIFISLTLYLLIYVSASFIAEFYHMPILSDVARVVSLTLIIDGLFVVQTAKLNSDLNFKLQSVSVLASSLISGAVGITLAYLQFGVWALVYQDLIAVFVRMVIIWNGSRWRPMFVFSKQSFITLFSFGSKLLGSSLISTIYQNLYTLLIGKFFTPSDVGYYNRGNHFAIFSSQICTEMLLKVNYPILSKLQDDHERLLDAYTKLYRIPMFLYFPLMFGLSALAYPLIDFLLGEKWLLSVPILQILVFAFMWTPLTRLTLTLLNVKGRSDLVLKAEIITKIISFIILFISIPFGILWMCVGYAVSLIITFVINCYYTKRFLGYGFYRHLRELLPILINAVVMCIVIRCCIGFIDGACLQLTCGVLVGILSYVGFAFLIKDKSLVSLMDIVRQRKERWS